ncbi:cellulose biosynthesis protein BcsD [Kerstersia sp.]|uniref:cellulose biosynthesis protein BcsD n=1 Tax=Kerstersia sp. TaxID=1930783 RepID=UPI003F9118CD
MDNSILLQLNEQQCSLQWKGFLDVFAQELTQQLTSTNLRSLTRRAGERFAKQTVLPETETVASLQDAINTEWQRLGWGRVVLVEESTHLVITHYFSPLLPGFTAANLSWTTGFLEGVYEAWLHKSGASNLLRVAQSGNADEIGTLVFHFGR